MSEREKILGRVREALRVAAPRPGKHSGHGSQSSEPPIARAREWLPATGESFDERLARFSANATELRAEFLCVRNEDELAARLSELCSREGWKRIATHAGSLAEKTCRALPVPMLRIEPGYDVAALEACDAGITECDALVAQTGSVVVTSRSAGGRALSVLPPHHVVLARHEQLVRDLPAAFELIQKNYGDNYPSMISFITGPSRTSDIERILVLGAHGPKKLTIFLIG